MIDFLIHQHPVIQALLAGTFTFLLTALGALGVFLTKNVNKKVMDTMLGFAAGVMIAASFWSLLNPAIEMSVVGTFPKWFPAATGFLAGGIFLRILDKIIPHLHLGLPKKDAEGIKTSWHKSLLLVLAITLHNFPEGLAIGVAFGAIGNVALGSHSSPEAAVAAAIALAIGIGIQNIPEGMAVAMPLRREGLSQGKSFVYGALSGIIEPVAAVIGATLVIFAQSFLPYALSFAAGAMIFVVVEEVIPEAQHDGNTDWPTMGALIGFAMMMVLDVAFS